jgi:hypothetical protein
VLAQELDKGVGVGVLAASFSWLATLCFRVRQIIVHHLAEGSLTTLFVCGVVIGLISALESVSRLISPTDKVGNFDFRYFLTNCFCSLEVSCLTRGIPFSILIRTMIWSLVTSFAIATNSCRGKLLARFSEIL